MTLLRVVHLVDDTTAGGVMRVLNHITTAPDMVGTARHSLRVIDRRSFNLGRIKADVIVSHLSISWSALPMLIALRATNARASLVHVEHSYTENFVALNVVSKRRFATLLRTAYALFDRVVAVSHAQGRWLSERGYVGAHAIQVIQSCADMAPFRAIAPKTGPVRVIGAVGRLDRQKGFDTLISAFRKCAAPDIALHIYGEGNEEHHLRALAEGDLRIRFMGFAPDPVAAMAAVDAVAMPSRWEAYGLVAIETLSAGRVLLANGVDGLNDHAPLGAHMVTSPSVRSWTQAINQLTQGFLPNTTPIDVLESNGFEARFAAGWREMLAALEPVVSRQA